MQINEAISVLKSGGVVMHPTETCYGLAVDVFNEEALRRLYKLKKMDALKPLSILVDGVEMAKQYGFFSKKALELADKYWPGPLSILVPRTENLPDFFNPGNEFVSMRHSSDKFSSDMVSGLGHPITTTSANIASEAPLYKVDRVQGFIKEIDLLVDMGEIPKNEPSTIVKVDGEKLVLVRQGSIYLK